MKQLVKLRVYMFSSEFAQSNFKSCHFKTENSMLVEKRDMFADLRIEIFGMRWFLKKTYKDEAVDKV